MEISALVHLYLFGFWKKNKHCFKKNDELKINDNALVALALLVAQSDPAEKDLMVQLIFIYAL
jgi:hypothetical protein